MYFSLLTTHPTDTKIPKNTTCKKKTRSKWCALEKRRGFKNQLVQKLKLQQLKIAQKRINSSIKN